MTENGIATPPGGGGKHRKRKFAVRAAIVFLLLVGGVVAAMAYENYLDHRDPWTTYDPNLPKWANRLAEKIARDPGYKAKRDVDLSDMVLIPAGPAIVGCQDPCPDDHLPRQVVDIPAFYIDRLPVTIAQYKQCVAEKMCLPLLNNDDIDNFALPDAPATLDFHQAERYCRRQGKRLPREFEWEKAARGTDGRRYPWGNQPPDSTRGNICDVNCTFSWADQSINDGYKHFAPVGSFPAGASPYGLLDAEGNIKEWVDGERAPGVEAIAKGSSWYSPPLQMAVYTRQQWRPGVRTDDKGVRCAFSKP